MNKMFIYILELDYSYYVERFKKDNKIKMKDSYNKN